MPGNRPPVFTATGRYVGDPFTVATAVAAAATGSSNWVEVGDYTTLRLYLTGVAFTGGAAPTVTAAVETSPDASTATALTASTGSLASASAGQTKHGVYTGLDRYVRVSWTTTGGPTNASFTVAGEAL